MVHRPTIAEHNWARESISDLLKTCVLNAKLNKLGIWPTLLQDMSYTDYKAYTNMLKSLTHREPKNNITE